MRRKACSRCILPVTYFARRAGTDGSSLTAVAMADVALEALSPVFNRMYVALGVTSEWRTGKLLRALLLRVTLLIRVSGSDGATRLRPAVPVVHGSLNMSTGCGACRCSARTGIRLMEADIAQKFLIGFWCSQYRQHGLNISAWMERAIRLNWPEGFKRKDTGSATAAGRPAIPVNFRRSAMRQV